MTDVTASQSYLQRIITASGLLLVVFFTIAPLSPRGLTAMAGLIALLAAAVGWRGLKRLPGDSRLLFAAFLLYVATALLSLLHNENWHAAGERFEKYHPFLFAIPLTGWLALMRDRLQQYLLFGLTGSAQVISAVAFYEALVLHVPRTGYLTGLEPNIFGHLGSMVALVLTGFALFSTYPRSLRLLLMVLALVTFGAVLTTGTRGAILAYLGGLLVLTIAWLLRDGISRRTVMVASLTLAAIALMLVLVTLFSETWREHWAELVDEPRRFLAGDVQYTSTAARLTLWLAGWKTAMANFWIGTGIGDNQLDYNRLMAAGQLPPIPDNSHFHLHNIYIDAFASTGIIGLAAMLLAVFIMPFRCLRKRVRDASTNATEKMAAMTGMALLANGFIFGMTYSWLYIRGLHFFLLLLLSLLVLACGQRRSGS